MLTSLASVVLVWLDGAQRREAEARQSARRARAALPQAISPSLVLLSTSSGA